jgi:ATP-grasp domain, R2K clade family 3
VARHADGMLLLVPADPLRPRRPDEHFAAEADAAKDGGLDVALIDHDALADPGGAARAVARVPNAGGTAIYRGWMLRADQYTALAAALEARDVTLRTSAAQYQRAHELPGWHAALSPVTPQAEWTHGDSEQDFHLACERLGQGPAVLRDYVKSMKHHWHEAAYIPDVADHTPAWKVASRFRELREDEFAGGFVLRRFENFASAEARTWWVDGIHRLTTAHPDTPEDTPPHIDLSPFAPLIASLALPFVTADLARRTDGTWRLIELGDGQVSDRPETTKADSFLSAILPLG